MALDKEPFETQRSLLQNPDVVVAVDVHRSRARNSLAEVGCLTDTIPESKMKKALEGLYTIKNEIQLQTDDKGEAHWSIEDFSESVKRILVELVGENLRTYITQKQVEDVIDELHLIKAEEQDALTNAKEFIKTEGALVALEILFKLQKQNEVRLRDLLENIGRTLLKANKKHAISTSPPSSFRHQKNPRQTEHRPATT